MRGLFDVARCTLLHTSARTSVSVFSEEDGTMQTTGSLRTIGRSGTQALVLTAVGALGLVIGRWVVPATDSAPAGVYQPTEASTIGRVADITELKFAQMDAAEARVRPAADAVASASTGPASHITQLKFAQMDAADAR